MAVKLDKLFRSTKFRSLSKDSKLLYFYLVTHKDLSVVGTLILDLEVFLIQCNLSDDDFRVCTKELINNGYLKVKKIDGVVYFIIPDHFNTIPKSESAVTRVNKALRSLPVALVTFLDSLGINTSSKVKTFAKPSAKEVSEYAFEFGYLINGQEFVDYYEQMAIKYGKKHWVDSRGTQVRDWKSKLRKVWFKPEKKLKTFDDAPEGFSKFYMVDGDSFICPDGWRNGKPFSKNVVVDMKLKKEYEKRKRSSS